MTDKVVNIQGTLFLSERLALVPAILFCLLLVGPYTRAQDIKVVNEKPHITQIFYPATNQTEVRVVLGSNSLLGTSWKLPVKGLEATFYKPGPPARVQSSLVLSSASHIYEGRTPTVNESVRLTFFSKRNDIFNERPSYSIRGDKQMILEGVAEQPELLASDKDYKQRIVVNVTTEIFLSIARAKKVEIKLGPKTYKLESFQQKSVRALAIIIDPKFK